MLFAATVTAVETDDVGCAWVALDITLTVGDRTCSTCSTRVAVPTTSDDNPWSRRGDDWQP